MVLKGVSQKVIEVVHTDNRYFEKAILFLRPNAQEGDKTQLRAKAGEYLSQIDYSPREAAPRRFSLTEAVKFGLAARGSGGGVLIFPVVMACTFPLSLLAQLASDRLGRPGFDEFY